MGVAVTFNAPPADDRRKQWKWFWGFAVVAGVVTVAQVWASARDREARESFEAKVTGGNNYAYFDAEIHIAPNGEHYVGVTTTGQMAIFDCSVKRLSADRRVVDHREWAFRPLPKVRARFSYTTLPPGEYRFDCIMGDKTWRQHLTFEPVPEGIKQEYRVEKDGEDVKEGSGVSR